jgi:hypothetical protein
VFVGLSVVDEGEGGEVGDVYATVQQQWLFVIVATADRRRLLLDMIDTNVKDSVVVHKYMSLSAQNTGELKGFIEARTDAGESEEKV